MQPILHRQTYKNSTQNVAKLAILSFKNEKNFWGGGTVPFPRLLPHGEGGPPLHTPPPRRLDTHVFGARTATFLFPKKALSIS